jgi:hypothetical protein
MQFVIHFHVTDQTFYESGITSSIPIEPPGWLEPSSTEHHRTGVQSRKNNHPKGECRIVYGLSRVKTNRITDSAAVLAKTLLISEPRSIDFKFQMFIQ